MRKLVLAIAIIGVTMFGVHSAADAGAGNPVTKKMKGSFSDQNVISGISHFDENICISGNKFVGSNIASGESTAIGQVRHLGLTEVYVDASWDWSVYNIPPGDLHADMQTAGAGYVFCVDSSAPTNTIIFTAANGDEIDADITGGRVNELCAGGGFEIIIDYTITGGTGRFVAATGGGTGITRVNFVDGCLGDPLGFIFSEFEGTVTY